MKKYYFVTAQAKNRSGDITTWNNIIDESPMKYILRVESQDTTYSRFVVINTLEITEEEYKKYKGKF